MIIMFVNRQTCVSAHDYLLLVIRYYVTTSVIITTRRCVSEYRVERKFVGLRKKTNKNSNDDGGSNVDKNHSDGTNALRTTSDK